MSTKRLSQGRFIELYQDYVCGSVLRIARELFALLPTPIVLINALGNLLDTASGHMRDQPIVSVIVPRETLEGLNFGALDPSDSFRNFNHRMELKPAKGFSPIVPFALSDIPIQIVDQR